MLKLLPTSCCINVSDVTPILHIGISFPPLHDAASKPSSSALYTASILYLPGFNLILAYSADTISIPTSFSD